MIKRYVAIADCSITNAFTPGLLTRGTGSNTGEADTCEIFSIYAQASTGSRELSRALFSFPMDEIADDRASGLIPVSGSASFYLQLFNAPHSFTTPRKYTLVVDPLTKDWDEGAGVDLDNYSDDGYCNWEFASSGSGLTSWTTEGGDFWHATYVPGSTLPYYNVYFDRGYEDLSCDITSLAEEWLAGTQDNYGVMVMLTSSIENALSSSYTKRFFTRGSEYFFKRPCIEVRWDDSRKDQRGVFYVSSSLYAISNNRNILYFYNYNRGELVDLPFSDVYVSLYTDPVSGSYITSSMNYPDYGAGKVATGIYTASLSYYHSGSAVYDRWINANTGFCFYTGSIVVRNRDNYGSYQAPKYVLSMPDLKSQYSVEDEKMLFRVSTVNKNWTPNYYTKMVNDPELQIIENLYYQVRRVTDGTIVVPFGTGSVNHTRCSYDVSGSYFYFDFSMLQSDFSYLFEFARKNSVDKYEKMKETFKFRVEA